MLKTTELFINELKERDLKYRDIRTLQDGDDLVEVGFNLDSTRIRIMIFFDASEKSVALRCFEVTRVTEEQYPDALGQILHWTGNECPCRGRCLD